MTNKRRTTNSVRNALLCALALAGLGLPPTASATHFAGGEIFFDASLEIFLWESGAPTVVIRGVNESGDRLQATGRVRFAGRDPETGDFLLEARLRGFIDPHEEGGEQTANAYTEPVPREGLIILPVGGVVRREGSIVFAEGILQVAP